MVQPDDCIVLSPRCRKELEQFDLSIYDWEGSKPSKPEPNPPGFSHEMAIYDYVSTVPESSQSMMPPDLQDRWESILPIFIDLYIRQDLSLDETGKIVAEQHGFHTSESEFRRIIRAYNLKKNLSAEEKDDILDSILQAPSIETACCVIRKHHKDWLKIERHAREKRPETQRARLRQIIKQGKRQGLLDTKMMYGKDKQRCWSSYVLGGAKHAQMTSLFNVRPLTILSTPEKITQSIIELIDWGFRCNRLASQEDLDLIQSVESLQNGFRDLCLGCPNNATKCFWNAEQQFQLHAGKLSVMKMMEVLVVILEGAVQLQVTDYVTATMKMIKSVVRSRYGGRHPLWRLIDCFRNGTNLATMMPACLDVAAQEVAIRRDAAVFNALCSIRLIFAICLHTNGNISKSIEVHQANLTVLEQHKYNLEWRHFVCCVRTHLARAQLLTGEYVAAAGTLAMAYSPSCCANDKYNVLMMLGVLSSNTCEHNCLVCAEMFFYGAFHTSYETRHEQETPLYISWGQVLVDFAGAFHDIKKLGGAVRARKFAAHFDKILDAYVEHCGTDVSYSPWREGTDQSSDEVEDADERRHSSGCLGWWMLLYRECDFIIEDSLLLNEGKCKGRESDLGDPDVEAGNCARMDWGMERTDESMADTDCEWDMHDESN